MVQRKILFTILISAIFIILSFTPAISAKTSGTIPIEPINKDLVLEIGYKELNGYTFYKKITVSEKQLEQFEVSWNQWESLLEEIRKDGFMDIKETIKFQQEAVSLIEEIKEITFDPETGTYAFPDNIGVTGFVRDSLFMNGFGRRIFSIGRGRAWLPFNRQGEQFIGMRFLPIFIQHSLGFTKVKRFTLIPPSFGVEDRLFIHNLLTVGFVGLYINFGERYFDRQAGPVILIGRSIGIRLGEDIP
jgi:hypothetical protein